jgi:hypothetical protein
MTMAKHVSSLRKGALIEHAQREDVAMKLTFFRLFCVCFVASAFAATVSAQTTGVTKPAPERKPAPTKPAAAAPAAAPEPPRPKPFTNDDVVKMVKAKDAEQKRLISDDEIVATIKAAQNKTFDFSADAVLALVDAGVSAKVRAAMRGEEYVEPKPAALRPAPPPTSTAPTTTSSAAPVTPEPTNQTKSESRWKKFGMGGVVGALTPDKDKNKDNPEKASANVQEAKKDEPPASGDAAIAVPKRGQSAIFSVPLSTDAACKHTVDYLLEKGAELAQADCNAKQLSTVAKAGQSFWTNAAKRAVITFIDTKGSTEVRVKIMEKGSGFFSTNGGKQADEKGEGVDTKSSAKIASDLRTYLNQQVSAR